MKTMQMKKLVIATALLALPGAVAQFTSGSDGSDGPLVVSENATLQVPEDGVFNFTTVDIASGKRLTLLPNANNTVVYFLSTLDQTYNGILDLNGLNGSDVVGGRGGPGGHDGGNPGSAGTPPGDGKGPGGGKGGTGSTSADGAGSGGHANKSTTGNSLLHGAAYGSAVQLPPEGGSGGGGTTGSPGRGGGGGGGAITVASSTRVAVVGNGQIAAIGGGSGGGSYNAGSGGGIRIVAPAVEGNGLVYAYGGGTGGGLGRIRVDTLDRSNLALRFNPVGNTTIGSMMVVRPDPMPRLDVIKAAGTDIAEGSGPVQVILPFGADPNVSVTVQASNFGAVVPITLALKPDSGPTVLYDAEIDNAAANPATVVIPVTLPINVQTTIQVWTR